MLTINRLRASILSTYVSGNAATVISSIVRNYLKDEPSYRETICSAHCNKIKSFPVVVLNESFDNNFANLSRAIVENFPHITKCSRCRKETTFQRTFNEHVFIEVRKNFLMYNLHLFEINLFVFNSRYHR